MKNPKFNKKEHKPIKGFYSKKLVFELIKKNNSENLDKEKIKELYLKNYDSEDIPLCINEEIDNIMSFNDINHYKKITEKEIKRHIPLYRGFNKIKSWYGSYKS